MVCGGKIAMDEQSKQAQIELDFFLKVHDDIDDKGVVHNYICPRCGGTIIAFKSITDGHLHMKCDNCKFAAVE